MSTEQERNTPEAWVLCEDERLHRFFEIELAHLGLAVDHDPSPVRAPALVVADTDHHAVEALLSTEAIAACSLLGFGYTPVDIPAGRGLHLRRPFSLRALEEALRQLLVAPLTAQGDVSRETLSVPASPLTPVNEPVRPASAAPPTDASLCLEEAHMAVTVGNFRVVFTPAEWAIFRCLYDRRGESVSHDDLSALLGGGGNSVEVYICRLRRKLEKPLGRRMIATVRGKGYRLT